MALVAIMEDSTSCYQSVPSSSPISYTDSNFQDVVSNSEQSSNAFTIQTLRTRQVEDSLHFENSKMYLYY